jgi:hypothetical protein
MLYTSSVAALLWKVMVGSAEFLRLNLGPVGDCSFVCTSIVSLVLRTRRE